MKFLLDTVNLKEIEEYASILPLEGVTSNPSIIKKEGKIELVSHMKAIRQIIGKKASLHIQVVASDYGGILKDAYTILEKIDPNAYIKIPVSKEGMKAMKKLKSEGVHLTATAIYTQIQGFYAIDLGTDFIAPYFNRMETMSLNPRQTIADFRQVIEESNSPTKIVAASFKNIGQVNEAILAGAHTVTAGTDVLEQGFAMPAIQKAVQDFEKDWCAVFGENKTVSNISF